MPGLLICLNFDMRNRSNALVRRQMDVRPYYQPRKKASALKSKSLNDHANPSVELGGCLNNGRGRRDSAAQMPRHVQLISHNHVVFCGEPDDPVSQFGHSRPHGIQ